MVVVYMCTLSAFDDWMGRTEQMQTAEFGKNCVRILKSCTTFQIDRKNKILVQRTIKNFLFFIFVDIILQKKSDHNSQKKLRFF